MASSLKEVPTLSLADYFGESTKKTFVSKLFTGLTEYGFVVIRNHSISNELLLEAYKLSQQFFTLPEATKSQYFIPNGGGARGYTPFGREHAKDAPAPDLKEFWHVGRTENVWPTEIANFRRTFETLFKELDNLGRTILSALTGPLQIETDFFDHMTDRGNSILRLLHYPPIAPGVDPRCIRAAAHEDINLITLLVAASATGLELKLRSGEWMAVHSEPMDIVVDSGDMLARLTNDVIPSTTHRVVNPIGPNRPRYSMPFFMHPNSDAMLSCLASCKGSGAKYPDILSDDFLQQRLREIGLKG
jgi:isopenicillin N synthase-like dioxygenase